MEENQLAARLMEVFNQFKRIHVKQSPVEGLTPGEVMLLIRIKKLGMDEEEGLKVSDLSCSMKVAPPSVTQLINALEAGGYVERRMDKVDRRAVRVRLTQKGAEAVEKAKGVFYQTISGLIEYLGEEKTSNFIEIMGEVYKYLEKIETSNNNGDTDRS